MDDQNLSQEAIASSEEKRISLLDVVRANLQKRGKVSCPGTLGKSGS